MTTEQLLLLNNLMYTYKPDAAGKELHAGMTVGEFINVMEPADYANKSNYMDTADWTEIRRAVENDPALMRMQIVKTGNDEPGGGFNAVFVDNTTKEAAVVFKGTQGDLEWRDNLAGGNLADTECQKGALNWYKGAYSECNLQEYSVTVTGHSKGGNKAKYVTLIDGNVDKCVSFDGQGFSDKFMETHSDEIALRQHLIENHSVDGDFVNFLLNDVGENHYYKAQNIGEGGFLENHCPNTFFSVSEGGQLIMIPGEQTPLMKELNVQFNGLLRSMPDDQSRNALLKIVGEVIVAIRCDDPPGAAYYLNMLRSPENIGCIAYAITYFATAAGAAGVNNLKSWLNEAGMGDLVSVIDKYVSIYNYIRTRPNSILVHGVSWLAQDILSKFGIWISPTLIRLFLTQRVELADGSDMQIASCVQLRYDSRAAAEAEQMFSNCIASLSEAETSLANLRLESALSVMFRARINKQVENIGKEKDSLQRMKTVLSEVSASYMVTEKSLSTRADG